MPPGSARRHPFEAMKTTYTREPEPAPALDFTGTLGRMLDTFLTGLPATSQL